MLLKNLQGCEVELYRSQAPSVAKVVDYPNGGKTSEVITEEDAQELVIKLITQNNFKIIF